MKKNKRKYLRIQTEKQQAPIFKKLPLFLRGLREHEFAISEEFFYMISLISGGIMWFIYTLIVHNQLISIAAGIIGVFIPYLAMSVPFLTNKAVQDAMAYKEFIAVIESALRSTNSTKEALSSAAEESNLPLKIRRPLQNVMSDIRLGDSLEEALIKAENQTDNQYFRIALTVIRINHNVGTAKTIAALDNIQKTMDASIDHIQLLKDKTNTIIFEKLLFFAVILVAPILHMTMFSTTTGLFYETFIFQLLMILILAFGLVGQLVINAQSIKALGKI